MAKHHQPEKETQVADKQTSGNKWDNVVKNNKKLLIGVGVAAVLIAGGFLYYNEFVKKPAEKEAEVEIYKAEYFFRLDSLNLALNGIDGQFQGLLSIADSYGKTKAGNRAKYMAGVSLLHLGRYEEAIDYLSRFKSGDLFLGAMALGCMGDAYRELGDSEQAAKYYEKAANKNNNELTTPLYLKKAAMTYEDDLQSPDKALKLYKKVRDEYGYLQDYKDITKYIARLEAAGQ